MIKGYLKGLFILGLTLLPISFSSALNTLNGVSVGEVLGSNNLCLINSNLSFNCSVSDNILVAQNGGYSSSFWWRNDGLGFYNYNSYTPSQSFQGVITGFKFCEYDFIGHNSLLINNSRYRPTSCLGTTYTYEQFREYISSHQLRAWGYMSESYGIGGPVFVFDEGAFRSSFDIGSYYRNLYYGTYYTTDFSLTGPGLSVSYNNVGMIVNPSVYVVPDNSPVVPVETIDGYDYIVINTGDAVLYFEDEKGYKKEMCYIGTKDLTSLYEDAIPYYQGSGYTIFDFYSKLYSTNSMTLKNVGIFINYQFRNFETWFMGLNRASDGTPLYNFVYNGPNNYYVDRGPGLTNPFVGHLSAFYFLGSIRADYSSYSDIDGEQLAYYCYKKLSYSSHSNDGQNYSITDDHNSVYDDWVAVYTRNQRNYRNQFSGSDSINSQSFHGTALDYFTGGEEDFTDFTSFFSKSFNRFGGIFNDITNADLGLGVLPSFIVMFLLALIFFRFISH